MFNLLSFFLITISFFIGAIPFGYIISKKFYGINIQQHGSGNIGSTNVNRVIGRKASIITQILDILKGLIPVAVASILLNNNFELPKLVVVLTASAAIVGHDFSPFLRFNGGKGINTTLGASLIIAPIPTLISVLIFFIIKTLSKYVSIGSMLIGVTLPISAWILNYSNSTLIYFIFTGILILLRHKDNLVRLWNKQENNP